MALIKIKQVDDLSNQLSAKLEAADLSALENSVDSLEASVNALQTQTASAATDAEMTAVENSIDSLEDSVGSIDTVLGTLALDSDMTVVENSIDSLEASVNALQTQTASAATDAEMTAVENSVDSLEVRAAALEADITSIEAAFVKDPFGIESFTAAPTLADNILTLTLAGFIEDAVNGNVVKVSVNGLVLEPNAGIATPGQFGYNVSSGQSVDIRLPYDLDPQDSVFVEYVRA